MNERRRGSVFCRGKKWISVMSALINAVAKVMVF
jgi:hypothetical protein